MKKVTKQLLTTAIFFSLSFLPKNSLTQELSDSIRKQPTDNAYRDATFACLKKSLQKIFYNPETGHWVDIKTGKAVSSSVVEDVLKKTVQRDLTDPNRAFDPASGQNYFWDKETKTWKDAKTGKSVTSNNLRDALFCCLAHESIIYNPETGHWVDIKTGKAVGSSIVEDVLKKTVQRDLTDPNRAFDPQSGRNFVYDKSRQAWIDTKTGECICPKCPPTETTSKDATKKSEELCCWIDVKTGKRVATAPLSGINIGGIHEGAKPEQHSIAIISDDRRTAYNAYTKQNYAKDKNGCWIDVKTGKRVATAPLSGINIGGIHEGAKPEQHSIAIISDDRRTAYNAYTKQNYARVACDSTQSTTAKDTTKKTAFKDFPNKDIFVGFSLIHEDNGSNHFYTYGGEFAYTHNLCRRGGITGDAGINFGSYGMVDYTKINILAGGIYYPIKTAVPASDFNFSVHALAGVSNIKSSYSIGSYSSSASNSYFTMDIGGGFNYYFGDKTGVGLRFGYMPTFSKGNTSNNFRVALGVDFR